MGKNLNELIRSHQRSVRSQDRLYEENLKERVRRNIPTGAGLDSDDLSKVASIEKITKDGEEPLSK